MVMKKKTTTTKEHNKNRRRKELDKCLLAIIFIIKNRKSLKFVFKKFCVFFFTKNIMFLCMYIYNNVCIIHGLLVGGFKLCVNA